MSTTPNTPHQPSPADQLSPELRKLYSALTEWDPAGWHRGARYAHRDLNPATQLYITVEDRLRIAILCFTGGVEVDVIARIQLPDGQVIPMRQQIFPANSTVVQNFDYDLCEGFLLDLSITSPTAALRIGTLFAVAQIIRGTGANALPSRTLIANYVTTGNLIGWPEGPNQQSVQGAGGPFTIIQNNPAAGADWTFPVPTGIRIIAQSLSAQLVTAVAVANRVPHLQLLDANNNVTWDCAASAAQAASLTVRYSACGGIQPAINDNSAIIPLPDQALLLQGWKLRSVTTAIQAADQWQNIWINCLGWVEL
jgi:hypothetical protein